MFSIAEMEDDDLMLVVAEAVERMENRVHLASLIMVEEKRVKEVKKTHLDITNDEIWRQCRFSRIVQMLGNKLKDQKLKKIFLDTFNKAYMKQLTYFEFHRLFLNTLGINNVAEWMFEDFVSALDDLGMAFVELNEIVKWLKLFDFDIGVAISQIDKSDEMMKKLKIDPL